MGDGNSPGAAGPTDAVVIERVLDAPVELVWQMWVDPEHFAAWYGPDGATIPVATMDVRVGGARRVCMEMQTPEGAVQMWFAGEFREIVEHERLVYTEAVTDEDGDVPSPGGATDGHPATTEVTVELRSLGDRTKLVLTHVGVPADSPGAVGWSMALDALARLVTAQAG
jgi:uncharacterized protein YndB with AHSA1/START domain